MRRNHAGFTIVELLIVIVVIGILAAITIVAYNGIQDRGRNTTVQSDIRNAGNKILQFYATEDRYPTTGELTGLDLKFSKSSYKTATANALIYCLNTSGSQPVFAIGGTSTGGKGYYYSSGGGLQERAGWGEEGNQHLCPLIGVPYPAGGVGYSSSWGHTKASSWATWANG